MSQEIFVNVKDDSLPVKRNTEQTPVVLRAGATQYTGGLYNNCQSIASSGNLVYHIAIQASSSMLGKLSWS